MAHERSHATLLVGRQRELELMRGVLERVRAEREPQLVTLVGVPGIGKSRLVHDLGLGIDGLEWLHGRCLPYGDGVTFWSLAEIVRSRLGLREGDPPAAVEAKLGDVVSDEWVNGHLRPLLGLEVESSGGDRSKEAYAAWRSFLETCAGEMPLAVVFEDLQWADDVLLDFIDHLVDWASGVALLVVCTTRPELLERRPGWGGGKTNATTISLPPLSDEETGRLVASLVGRPLMVADVQSALIARAGGNPLYAEQFALLVDDQEAGSELPETVQGLIAARIDLLAPEQKAHLQDASVLGRTFWLDALAATSGVDRRTVEVGLHALERKSFVRRERTTSLAGQVEYTFQHVLVADVAYGQIPRAARSEKHQLAAEWIASAASAEDTAELRAHHWGEALSLARAARLDTTALEEPVRIAFRDAADRAFDLSAYPPAARLYEQALELWPESDPERSELLFRRARAVQFGVDQRRFDLFDDARDALLAAGHVESAAESESLGALALRNAGRGVDALARARAAVELVEDRPESRSRTYVIANCARLLTVLAFEHEEAIQLAEMALAAARELGLRDLEAHCLNTIGVARIGLWDVDGISDLEESLRIGMEHCSPFEVARIYNNLQSCYLNVGRIEECAAALRAALAMAEKIGLPDIPRIALNIASADLARGRWQEACDRIEELGDAAVGDYVTDGIHMEVLLARDDIAGATAACDHAIAEARTEQGDLDTLRTLQFFLGFRARIAVAEGRREAARALVDELLASGLDPLRTFPPNAAWMTLLLVELDYGDRAPKIGGERVLPWHEAARAIADGRLTEAADRLEAIGDVTFAAETRLVALRQLAAEGRRVDVAELLPKVLGFYRSVGATRYVREAEVLLQSVA